MTRNKINRMANTQDTAGNKQEKPHDRKETENLMTTEQGVITKSQIHLMKTRLTR